MDCYFQKRKRRIRLLLVGCQGRRGGDGGGEGYRFNTWGELGGRVLGGGGKRKEKDITNGQKGGTGGGGGRRAGSCLCQGGREIGSGISAKTWRKERGPSPLFYNSGASGKGK